MTLAIKVQLALARAVRWASSLAPSPSWACRCPSPQAVAPWRCDGFPLGDLCKGPTLRGGLSKADFLNTPLKSEQETPLPGRRGFRPTKGPSGTARLVAAASRQAPALLEPPVMGTACGTPGRVIQEHTGAVLSTEGGGVGGVLWVGRVLLLVDASPEQVPWVPSLIRGDLDGVVRGVIAKGEG